MSMKQNYLDVDKLIKVNKLPEVTSPGFFSGKSFFPDEQGVFSFSIFGTVGTDERLSNFGYIKLNTGVFHPHMWKELTRMDMRLAKIASGEMRVRLSDSGELIEDENGNWGIPWLIKNIRSISFTPGYSGNVMPVTRMADGGNLMERLMDDLIEFSLFMDSDDTQPEVTRTRAAKLALLGLIADNRLSSDKLIVIPAGYREYTRTNNRVEAGILNELYSNVISSARILESLSPEDEIYLKMTGKLQNQVLDVYDVVYLNMNWGGGKESYWKKMVLGAHSDLSATSVLGFPKFNANTDRPIGENNEVKFSEAGYALHQLCALFWPLVIHELNAMFLSQISSYSNIQFRTGESVADCESIGTEFNPQKMAEWLVRFAKCPEIRWMPLQYTDKSTGKVMNVPLFEKQLGRQFTLCDMFFIACMRAIKNKHLDIVRYPVETHQSHTFVHPIILTTEETVEMDLGLADGPIRNYPKYGYRFKDVVALDVSQWPVQGADSDGDMEMSKALMSKESNAEISKIRNSKRFVLNATGETSREYGREVIIALFSMTVDKDLTPKHTTGGFSELQKKHGENLAIRRPRKLTEKETRMFLEMAERRDLISLDNLYDMFTASSFTEAPEFSFQDTIVIPPTLANLNIPKGQKEPIITTVGRYLFNLLTISKTNLIDKIGFVNETITAKQLSGIMAKLADLLLFDHTDVDNFGKFFDCVASLGFGIVTIVPGYSTKLLELPEAAKKLKEKYLKENPEYFDPPNVIKILEIQDEILSVAKEALKDDPSFLVYHASGCSGNFANIYTNIALWEGLSTDLSDPDKFHFISSSLAEGNDGSTLEHKANAAVYGAVSRAVFTAIGGYFEKILAAIANCISVNPDADSDCGVTFGQVIPELTPGVAKLIRLAYAVEPDGSLVLLDQKELDARIGKSIEIRNPMTCKSETICGHCFGRLSYQLGMNERGILALPRMGSIRKLWSMKGFHDLSMSLSSYDPDQMFEFDQK